MEELCLLVKRLNGVLTFKPSQRYIVGTLRAFLKLPDEEQVKYVILAEHYDREVLNQMKQLAIEGDTERLDHGTCNN
jgi:hypothetical protein